MTGIPDLIDPRVVVPPPPPAPDGDLSDTLDGVIIPVWAGDLYMAKACCASVRKFMGNIPITLWVDGPADTTDLEQLPNVSRMQLQEVVSPEYARLFTGSTFSKLPLFWASPYERFLCIDSDTIVWGDVRCYAEFDKYDFIASHALRNRGTLHEPAELARLVADEDTVAAMDPTLEWRGCELAVMGVFFARRNVFSEERLMKLAWQDCWRRNENYEQGLLNLLIWRSLEDGTPRMGSHSFQVFPPETTMPPEDRFLPADLNKPVMVHWLGKKPKLGRTYAMADEFRKLFLSMTGKRHLTQTRILMEDIRWLLWRKLKSIKRRLSRNHP